MEYTYTELRKKTVAQLREIAEGIEHEAVEGFSQLNKDQLLEAVCTALGLETRRKKVVVGIDKTAIKADIKALKVEREAALEAHDSKQLKKIRRKIRSLKRTIRKAEKFKYT